MIWIGTHGVTWVPPIFGNTELFVSYSNVGILSGRWILRISWWHSSSLWLFIWLRDHFCFLRFRRFVAPLDIRGLDWGETPWLGHNTTSSVKWNRDHDIREFFFHIQPLAKHPPLETLLSLGNSRPRAQNISNWYRNRRDWLPRPAPNISTPISSNYFDVNRRGRRFWHPYMAICRGFLK